MSVTARPPSAKQVVVHDAESSRIAGETVTLTRLTSEYDELVAREPHEDGDCHWQIGERWSYGGHAGWFIEHYGSCYALRGDLGEAGPYRSRDEALRKLADHLRSAIAEARERHGG